MPNGKPSARQYANQDVAMVFIGCVVPDPPPFPSVAFSRAGNMAQENLLNAMKENGLSASVILSQHPLRAFPGSRTLWFTGRQVVLNSGLPTQLVSFLNWPVLRPISVGLAVLINLIQWGLKHRSVSHKLIYTYNLTEPPGLFTLLGARLIHAKAVASVYDINVPGETTPATLSRKLDFWLQKRLIPRFDGLVVINKRIIEDFAPNTPSIRIEGGVNENTWHLHPDPSHTSDEANKPFTIVSAGGLSETNGFIEMLEAFALLPGDGYRLHIAGRGPLEHRISESARNDPRIEFCGYLSFENILALYATADVLINMRLTQRLRTDYFYPSKTFEYLASGIPVITTCTGHVQEEYADIAFLLTDETPQGLASMIEHVASLDSELRAQKGEAAREYMLKNCTWEKQGRRVVQFCLEEVLGLS